MRSPSNHGECRVCPDIPDTRRLDASELEVHVAMGVARRPDDPDSLEDARLFAAAEARLFGQPATPVEIDRYTVLERLGAGAMGEVYSAYDDRLDRKVALKLMLPGTGDEVTRAHERMLREGQTLARLSHPNVVQVFEVGTFEGRVFIAMEFVRGQTLRAWLAREPRSWREILAHYQQAGRGLLAAHRAELIHRDFKPDNVLVGDDGRVRVVDFGLARDSDPSQGSTARGRIAQLDLGSSSAGITQVESARLTRTGAVLGTPAYMSPEQFRGGDVGPLSDQFGFCVALYEGLYGRRPFTGKTHHQLGAHVMAGRCQPPPRGSGVPPWIWPILRRGLATEPEQRFESMAALLAALERDPARRRRRLAGGGALLALGLGAGLTADALGEPPTDPCPTAASLLQGAWDPPRRQQLDQAFVATGLGHAGPTRDRVIASLDTYARSWLGAHRDACEATHVHHTQSERLLDLRMGCLHGRRERLAALTERLSRAGPSEVTHGVAAVAGLPDLEACRDPELLRQVVRPPEQPEVVAEVAALRSRLAPLYAMEATGHHREARPEVERVVQDSAALSYAPLEAEARYLLGVLATHLDDPQRAEAELLRAVDLAEGSRHDEQGADAWLALTRLGLESLADPERAARWLARARAAVTRLGGRGSRAAQVTAQQASVQVLQGRPEHAIDGFERALERLGTGPDTALTRASVLQSLANAQQAASRFSPAADTYRRAEALLEQALGERHPAVGDMAHDRGTFLVDRGELGPARALLERARSIWREAYGDRHFKVGRAHLALAKLDVMDSEFTAARRHALRAREIYALRLEATHPERARPDLNLGVILFYQQDYAGAQQAYQRALDGLRRALPPGHEDIGLALANLGEVLLVLDRPQDAQHALDEAEAILRALPEPEPEVLSLVLKGQGQALLGAGRPHEAVERLTQALELRQRTAVDPHELADLRATLAQARAEAGRRPQPRARSTRSPK